MIIAKPEWFGPRKYTLKRKYIEEVFDLEIETK